MRRAWPALIFQCALLVSTPSHSLSAPWKNAPAFSIASERWNRVDDASNLQIYTAPYGESDFSAFKAHALLNQPLASVLAVISDPSSCPGWVDGCLDSGNLEVDNFNKRVAYALNALPWPFKNREVIVNIQTESDSQTGEIVISMFTQTSLNERIPLLRDDTVRIEHSHAQYLLRKRDAVTTELIWMQHTEPSGILPAWLVNSLIIDLPKNSIRQLETLAGESRYQDATIHYEEGAVSGLSLESGELLNENITRRETDRF